MSFGSYPQLEQRGARTKWDEARALIAPGTNPSEQRKQQRLAVRLSSDHAFEAVFNQWIVFRRLSLKEKRQSTLSQMLRIFAKDILPYIGDRFIHDITRHVLVEVLDRIGSRSAFTTAEKCPTWLNQLFRYALVRIAGLEHNPAADLDAVAMPKPPVEHNLRSRKADFDPKWSLAKGSNQPETDAGSPQEDHDHAVVWTCALIFLMAKIANSYHLQKGAPSHGHAQLIRT